VFETITSKIRNRWFEFSNSILYYPILFLLGSFSLFVITATIDPYIPRDYEFSLFNPLVFTGSADAARSILSTVATGWTTILGVAFSVTLITLQLSSSKYISRLVSEFQNDKINQLTLGWFIFVSSYSLLILKTVRTDEADGVYIPILGTNIALAVAIIGLLIFVVYIHNISNYLRPNILISRLIDDIISSLKKYEKRKSDKKLIFDKKPFGEKICDMRSTNTGIITSINWQEIQNILIQFQTDTDLWMEWYKSIGDWSGKEELLVAVYKYIKEGKEETYHQINKSEFLGLPTINKNNYNDYNENYSINKEEEEGDDISFNQKILNCIQITNDSNLSEDPILGIRLLGEMAVKSNNLRDYDVVNSVVMGLFQILIYTYSNEEKLGLPFTISSEGMHNKKIRKINLNKKTKNKDNTDKNNEIKKEEKEEENEKQKKKKERIIIINPREVPIQDVIIQTLTTISSMIVNKKNTSSNEQICKQYIATSKYLLEINKINEFQILTEWYSNRLFLIKQEFSDSLVLLPILNLLLQLKEDLNFSYPYAVKTFSVFMDEILKYRDEIVSRKDIE
jgi:hypothetical protein